MGEVLAKLSFLIRAPCNDLVVFRDDKYGRDSHGNVSYFFAEKCFNNFRMSNIVIRTMTESPLGAFSPGVDSAISAQRQPKMASTEDLLNVKALQLVNDSLAGGCTEQILALHVSP